MGRQMKATRELLELHQQMTENKEEMDRLKAENDRLRARVTAIMIRERATSVVRGRFLLFWAAPAGERRTVDTDAMKFDGVYDKYALVKKVAAIVRHYPGEGKPI